MGKFLLAILLSLALNCLVAPAQQQAEEDLTKLLLGKKAKHDCGTVARGTILSHTFKLRNRLDVPLEIVSLRHIHIPGTAKVSPEVINPKESRDVRVVIDTRRFSGEKTMNFFISLAGKGIQGKVVLTVSVYSLE